MAPTAQQLTNNLYSQWTGNRQQQPQQQQPQQQGFNFQDFMRALQPSYGQSMANAQMYSAAMGPATAYAGQRAGAGANQAVGAMNAQVAREQMPYNLEAITRQAGYPAQASVYGSALAALPGMYGSASRLTGLREVLAALPGMYGSIGGAGGTGGIPNMTTPYGGGYQYT